MLPFFQLSVIESFSLFQRNKIDPICEKNRIILCFFCEQCLRRPAKKRSQIKLTAFLLFLFSPVLHRYIPVFPAITNYSFSDLKSASLLPAVDLFRQGFGLPAGTDPCAAAHSPVFGHFPSPQFPAGVIPRLISCFCACDPRAVPWEIYAWGFSRPFHQFRKLHPSMFRLTL